MLCNYAGSPPNLPQHITGLDSASTPITVLWLYESAINGAFGGDTGWQTDDTFYREVGLTVRGGLTFLN